jgi:uncharacterized protein YfaQ (DUF2300 family)
MFAPNISTHQLADAIHQERQADAALIREAKIYRASHVSASRHTQRRITTRRFAATLAGAVLTLAVAAAVAANQPAAAPGQQPSNGGSLILIR